jgi:hypothetical protein
LAEEERIKNREKLKAEEEAAKKNRGRRGGLRAQVP